MGTNEISEKEKEEVAGIFGEETAAQAVESKMNETYGPIPGADVDSDVEGEEFESGTPETNNANFDSQEEELKGGHTKEERIAYAERIKAMSRAVAKKNHNALYNALLNNKLPAFHVPSGKDGVKIPAVISFASGKAYQGLNQLIGQKYVRDMDFKTDKNGNYPVLTMPQAGGAGNLKRGRSTPRYSFTTLNNGKRFDKETKTFVARTYANGEEVKPYHQLYTVYSFGDVKDIRKALTVPEEQRTKLSESKIEIDATNPKDGKEYLAKYLAATQNGFKFKTTPEVQESMRQQVLKDLGPYFQNGEDWNIGKYIHERSVESKGIVEDAYRERGKAIEAQRAAERKQSQAHNKSLARDAMEM